MYHTVLAHQSGLHSFGELLSPTLKLSSESTVEISNAMESVHFERTTSHTKRSRLVPCTHLNIFVLVILLSFITVVKSSTSVSAFVPHRRIDHSRQINSSRTSVFLNISPRPPEDHTKLERYNDDAFGLVFLAGGLISQDIIFASTFLTISAITAISTSGGILNADARIPGTVALTTLVLSPIVESLRSTGSFENITPPVPIEIVLCTVSFLVSIFNWKRGQE
jgi:hypothetical protein